MTKLTLEAGKYYKTRDGLGAYCVGICPDESSQPAVIVISCALYWYSLNGARYNDGLVRSQDIVSEWQDEPETMDISEWYQGVRIKEDNSIATVTNIFSSKEEALGVIRDINSTAYHRPCKYGVLKLGTTIITDIQEV